MRAGEFALEWITVRAISFHMGADDELDRARFHVDHADGMTLAISKPHVAVGIDRDAFGATECGTFGRSAVAGEAAFSGARNVENLSGLEVEFENLIPFARGQPEIALLIEVE